MRSEWHDLQTRETHPDVAARLQKALPPSATSQRDSHAESGSIRTVEGSSQFQLFHHAACEAAHFLSKSIHLTL
jgi:hypothetical protein